MAAGDFRRARWAAENALALAPEHSEARLLFERARAELTRAAVGPDDSTADLRAAAAGIGGDDTLPIAPAARFGWLVSKVGGWRSAVRGRWPSR
jgi:hypothetical protein